MTAQLAIPEWVCARCGSPGAAKQDGYLQFDMRYATGYCDTCNPPESKRKTPRPVQRLIRADVFDRDAWTERKEKAELAELVREYGQIRSTTPGVKMDDAQVVRLVYLYDLYGFAGFVLRDDARAAVAAHTAKIERRAEYSAKAKKRRR